MSKKARPLAIWLGVVASAATLGLVAVLLTGVFSSTQKIYLDGQGPLASTGDYGHASSEGFPAYGSSLYGGPVTLGFRLCIRQGSHPAVIRSVTPTQTVGGGYRIVGMYARTIDLGTGDEAIIGVNGFPPRLPLGSAHPDPLYPVNGYTVTAPCSETNGAYDELLIGFDATPGQGGGWLGINVTYTDGGSSHVVSLPYRFFICGPLAVQRYSVCQRAQDTPASPADSAGNVASNS